MGSHATMNEAGSIVQDNSVDNGEGTVAERIGQWETLPLKDRVTQLFQLFDRLPNDNDAYICELYTIVRLLQAPDTTARLHGTSHLKDLYTDWANNTMFSAKWERELEHNGRPFTIPYGHLVWRSPASQTVKQDIIARQLMRQCKEYDDAAKAQRFIHMDIEAEERDILHGFPGRHPHQKWSQTQRLKQIKSDMHNLESSIDGIVHGNDSKMSLVIPLLIAHATTNFGSPKWDQYSRYWLQWVWGDQGLKKTLEDRSPIDHILEIRKAAAAATLLFETAVTSWIKNNYFNMDEAELLPRYYVLLRCHHLHTNNLSDYLEFFEGCDDPDVRRMEAKWNDSPPSLPNYRSKVRQILMDWREDVGSSPVPPRAPVEPVASGLQPKPKSRIPVAIGRAGTPPKHTPPPTPSKPSSSGESGTGLPQRDSFNFAQYTTAPVQGMASFVIGNQYFISFASGPSVV